jgi:hypothetical protein
MALLIRRPLSAGELLDLSFAVTRRHLWSLLGLGGLPLAVALLLDHVLRIFGVEDTLSIWMGSLVGIAALGLAECRMIVGAWQLIHGQAIDPAAARERVRAMAVPVVLGYGLKWTLVVFGLVLLLVPGILVLLRWFAVPAVTALEQLGVRDSVRRSRALARGHLRRLLATVGVFDLAMIAVSIAVAFFYADEVTDELPLWAEVAGWVWTALMLPFRSTLVVAVYADIRVRDEAYDLEAAAAELTGVG